ncbi:MAG: phosphoribosylglycinamide formyltransferase, partial [Candidatus Limnocylindria bacterium]
MKLGVLVSGRGSNLEAVLTAVADGRLSSIVPTIVISNRAAVPALAIAARHGVATRVLRRADFVDRAARDAAIGRCLA